MIIIFVALFSSVILSSADEPPISATVQISPDTFTIGDIATYTITIQHDPDFYPSAPVIEPPVGLESVENGENLTRDIKGQAIHEYWYKFRVDSTGEINIPSVPVSFKAPDPDKPGESIQGKVLAPEVNLKIQSLLNLRGDQEGIHDIKPLEEISPPWTHYLWIALGVIAVSGLIYFLWRKWKFRTLPQTMANPVPALTPAELAFKELEALSSKGLIQIGRIQEHFFELSEIFRRYLENRYQFPAREWTTEEITSHFKHFSGLNANLKHRAQTILVQTDRIKFAKGKLAEGRDEVQTVINFVQESRPPEPVSAREKSQHP